MSVLLDQREDRFSALFGTGRSNAGPDRERDALGTTRWLNLRRLLELFGVEHESYFTVTEAHRYATGICAIGFQGDPFISIDRGYASISELDADIDARINNERDPNPPPSFIIDLDEEDPAVSVFVDWPDSPDFEKTSLLLSEDVTAVRLHEAQCLFAGSDGR